MKSKISPSGFVYAAGISNRNGNWIWQGTVVAGNKKHALRMLSRFKKEKELGGLCQVEIIAPKVLTSRPYGVSNSMNLD